MATRASTPPIAVIQIRDNQVFTELQEIKKTLERSGVLRFGEELAYGFGRDLTKAFELLGISTSVLSAGLVASLAAMTRSLTKFAQKSMALRNTADSLNLTLGEFKQLINIGVAQGLSPEEARENIEAFARAVLDLRRGVDSDTRRKLEERGAFGSGTVIARQIQRRLEQSGGRPYEVMRDILQQMARGARGSEHDRLATQIWREVFDLGSPAWNEAADNIEQFSKEALGPAEEDLIGLLLEKANQDRELENFWNQLREATLPVMEKLNDVVASWLEPERLSAFIARVKGWAENLRDQPWDQIRRNISNAEGAMSGVGKFGLAVVRVLGALGRITATIARWHKDVDWPGKGVPHLDGSQKMPVELPYTTTPSNTDWRGTVGIQVQGSMETPAPRTTVNTPAQGGQGQPRDLAAELGLGGLERMAGERGIQLPEVTVEGEQTSGPFHFVDRPTFQHFQRDLDEMQREFHDTIELIDVDKVKIIIGRTSGKGGGVTETSQSPVFKTKGGGASAPKIPPTPSPFPPRGIGREFAQRLAPSVSPLSRLGLQSAGEIKTYQEHLEHLQRLRAPDLVEKFKKEGEGAYGFAYTTPYKSLPRSIYFSTEQESPTTTLAHEGGHVGRQVVQEAGKRDPTLRGYGVSLNEWRKGSKEETAQRFLDLQEAQSLFDQGIIGKKEFETARFRAFAALGGQDISAEDRLEYTRHNKMYQDYATRMLAEMGKADLPKMQDFPPDWKYNPRTGERIPGRQERDQIDGALNGWRDEHDDATLDLNVNVRAARGTKVDTGITDGSLMADDRTTVSRVLQ